MIAVPHYKHLQMSHVRTFHDIRLHLWYILALGFMSVQHGLHKSEHSFVFADFRLRAAVPTRGCSCLHVAAQREQEPLGAGGCSWCHTKPVCRTMDC